MLLLAAHAAAAPRVRHALAALEADIDALERMQSNPMLAGDCGDLGNAWAAALAEAVRFCDNWRNKRPDKQQIPECAPTVRNAQRGFPCDQRVDQLVALSRKYSEIGTGDGMTWKDALHVLVKFYGSAFALAAGTPALDPGIWGTIATKGFEKLVEVTAREESKPVEDAKTEIEEQGANEEKMGDYLKEAIGVVTKMGVDIPDEITDNAIDFVLTKREEIKLAYLEAAQRDGKADTYNAKEEVFDTMFQELQSMKQS